MELNSIKVGMDYSEIRKKIIQSENLTISNLPAFCSSNYMVAENLDTKEKIYVLRDYTIGIITDVTTDYNKAVNTQNAENILTEILKFNG